MTTFFIIAICTGMCASTMRPTVLRSISTFTVTGTTTTSTVVSRTVSDILQRLLLLFHTLVHFSMNNFIKFSISIWLLEPLEENELNATLGLLLSGCTSWTLKPGGKFWRTGGMFPTFGIAICFVSWIIEFAPWRVNAFATELLTLCSMDAFTRSTIAFELWRVELCMVWPLKSSNSCYSCSKCVIKLAQFLLAAGRRSQLLMPSWKLCVLRRISTPTLTNCTSK